MEFSEKLRELRQSKGISQAMLAKAIFISRSAVAKWENGLGLPSEESLAQLCAYFGVSAEYLLPDQASEKTLVEKKRAIENQSKIIIVFACGAGLLLFLLAFVWIEPLREHLTLIALGVMFTVLGAFNMKGNIATIHWYNRRKVSKEDQLPYCRLIGWGTLVMGVAMVISAVVQALVSIEAGSWIIMAGVVIGLALILTAQFKYNKGIF